MSHGFWSEDWISEDHDQQGRMVVMRLEVLSLPGERIGALHVEAQVDGEPTVARMSIEDASRLRSWLDEMLPEAERRLGCC